MKIQVPLFALFAACLAASAHSQDPASHVSKVLVTHTPNADAHSPGAMAKAANAFLDSLDEAQRAQAALPFDSEEKAKWTNVPPRGPQGGVRLGDCNEAQLKLACDLLRTVMSRQGYEKARNIMLADDLLLRDGKPRPGFGAENFWLAVFGKPSASEPWAIQLDGHHVAINLSFRGDKVSMSPSFIGTQPKAIKYAGKDIEVMEGERGVAFKLINSLSDEQKRIAIISRKRGGIATAAGKDGVVPEPVGFPCSEFDKDQRALLMELLGEFVGDLPKRYAKARMAQLEKEIDQMKLAWSGPTSLESDISYRIQGPTLIIEYACQDLGGDPLDHLHSMYRDPTNEYGAGAK